MRTLLLCAAIILCAGCNKPPALANIDAAPRSIPTKIIDLNAYHAPEQIGPFTLQGNMTANGNQSRLFRYASSNAEQSLSILIYPLPGGWEEMDAEQQVAGHYGQIRQEVVKRLIDRGATRVEIENEKIYSTSDAPSDNEALTAESSIMAFSTNNTVTQTLMLRKSGDIYIRLVLIDLGKKNSITLARSTFDAFDKAISAP